MKIMQSYLTEVESPDFMKWLKSQRQFNQQQDSITDQLIDLQNLADKFGMTLGSEMLKTVLGHKSVGPAKSETIANWIKDAQAWPKRTDSLRSQVRDLERVAVKFGLYDAQDFLKTWAERHPNLKEERGV